MSSEKELVEHIYAMNIAIILLLLAVMGMFWLICCVLETEICNNYSTHHADLKQLMAQMKECHAKIANINSWVIQQRHNASGQASNSASQQGTLVPTSISSPLPPLPLPPQQQQLPTIRHNYDYLEIQRLLDHRRSRIAEVVRAAASTAASSPPTYEEAIRGTTVAETDLNQQPLQSVVS